MAVKKGRRGLLQYNIQGPIWTYPAQACRYALAGTRRKPRRVGSDDRPDAEDLAAMEQFADAPPIGDNRRDQISEFISLHTSRILRDHRIHLEKLHNAGWPPLLGDKAWYRALNCPPVGVVTSGDNLNPPCHHRSLCPWCWCRSIVRETYLNVEYAVYNSNSRKDYNPQTQRRERPLRQGPWHLLLLERDFGCYDIDHMPEMWRDIRATRVLTPSYLEYMLGTVHGLYYLYAIYPTDPRTEEAGFVVKKRIIVMVDQTTDWEVGEGRVECYPLDGSYSGELICRKRCHKMTRPELIGIVGMACSYPRQLLYGPVDLLQLLLEQKRRKFIPPGQRVSHLEAERKAELLKRPEHQDPDIIYGRPRAYERNSGVRLCASLGMFRNRAARLRQAHLMQRGAIPLANCEMEEDDD